MRRQGITKAPSGSKYNRRLTRRIRLKDGTTLVTLADAADMLSGKFGNVSAWDYLLEAAIQRLSFAATTGKRADIAEATTMVERVLQARRLF
jgi:hypothetical protein